MRTTLTLDDDDDDVAAALERRRAWRGTRRRDEVNQVLRAGRAATEQRETAPDPYEIPVFDSGPPRIVDGRDRRTMLDDEDFDRGLPTRS